MEVQVSTWGTTKFNFQGTSERAKKDMLFPIKLNWIDMWEV